jgi:lactonase
LLEGPAFERNGNLLFCDASGKRVLRLTPDKRLSTVSTLDDVAPAGIAVHKDGRLFIAALDPATGIGAIFSVNPDGTGRHTIVPTTAGYMPNDLVFDAHGGFYFSDFKGISTEPKGGAVLKSAQAGPLRSRSRFSQLPVCVPVGN